MKLPHLDHCRDGILEDGRVGVPTDRLGRRHRCQDNRRSIGHRIRHRYVCCWKRPACDLDAVAIAAFDVESDECDRIGGGDAHVGAGVSAGVGARVGAGLDDVERDARPARAR